MAESSKSENLELEDLWNEKSAVDNKANSNGQESSHQLENSVEVGEVKAPSATPKKRTVRTYPACTFSDALEIGQAIYEYAGGSKIRRLTLLEKMGRSPTSGSTRTMITNSNKYGITKGSYSAEHIELTSDGAVVFDTSQAIDKQLNAKFSLAIANISPFKKIYEEYVGKKLAAQEVIRDFLRDSGESISNFKECVDFFVVNAEYLNLLRTIGGAQTLISIEQLLDENGSVRNFV